MITFTRAPTVTPGQEITSSQIAALARAWNDRLLLIGDLAWRFVQWHFNLWRQIRNPDSGGYLFPAQGEAFELYHHLDPDWHQGTIWPVAGPGEAEGANLANPMAQFVFGNPDMYSEDVRLETCPLWVGSGPPQDAEGYWTLGKLQRGAYDPVTGAQYVPAFTAAQDFFRITAPYFSPHGKAYGGYFPLPTVLLTNCGDSDPDSAGYDIPSYEIKFTGLRTDVEIPDHHGALSYDGDGRPVITYSGTCPCGSVNYDSGHVLGIYQLPFAYYVFVGNDPGSCAYDTDRFPIADWIQGPYDGEAILQRTDGQQLHRALWAFGADFRGRPEERGPAGTLGAAGLQLAGKDDFDIERLAFDFQDFHTLQYPLAPARGIQVADTIIEVYPRVEWKGPAVPANAWGSFCHHGGGGTRHTYAEGFVCAGLFAKATGLARPATVQFLSGSSVIGSLTLTPDAGGAAQALIWLRTAVRPDPLRIRLVSGAKFTSSAGKIEVEANELMDYRPEYWDSYLVLRLSSTSGGSAMISGVDGRGVDYASSQQIGKNLFRYGCIVGPGAVGVRSIAEWINDNPIYDAARRLTRDHCRILRRQAFTGYDVGSDGKSVLYFKRFAYGMHNIRADLFHGIAPPIDPVVSGNLIQGETYLVRGTSGTVIYASQSFRPGTTFTATAGTVFTAGGDCQVYVKDGIRQVALKKGWTNRWVLFLETHCYNPSATSVFKPEAYTDYFTWCQRCHFHSGNVPSARFRAHVNFNYGVELDTGTYMPHRLPEGVQSTFVSPEAPTGYRYGLQSNQNSPDPDFCESCQIYEAPYEIESCTVHDWSDDQVVKVVLSRRLRPHPDAPSTVDLDPSSWSTAEVDILRNQYTTDPAINENYRTDDNAIREYVWHLHSGQQCTLKLGDAGNLSSEYSSPDVYGSCYPHFFLARLMPEPYEDGNNTSQPTDARCTIDAMLQAEILTRSCAEAFVDGQTSLEKICATPGYSGGLYDFTFENLCLQAFSGRWIGAFPLVIRPDGPAGFGPLPNTEMYAGVWNQLASCVNLLTRLRLDLPVEFKYRQHQYSVSPEITATYESASCSLTTDGLRAWRDEAPQPVGSVEDGGYPSAWTYSNAIEASWSAFMDGCPYSVSSVNLDVEYLAEIDSDFLNAIPDDLLAHIQDGGAGFIAIQTDSMQWWTREATTAGNGDACGTSGADFYVDGSGTPHRWIDNTPADVVQCLLVGSGLLSAPLTPAGDLNFGIHYQSGLYYQCGVSEISTRSLELVNDRSAFIEFPLTD